MRISQSTIIILILMLVFSVLLGNVANLLNTQTVYETSSEEEEINKLNIGAEFDHLIWFLQVNTSWKIWCHNIYNCLHVDYRHSHKHIQ